MTRTTLQPPRAPRTLAGMKPKTPEHQANDPRGGGWPPARTPREQNLDARLDARRELQRDLAASRVYRGHGGAQGGDDLIAEELARAFGDTLD